MTLDEKMDQILQKLNGKEEKPKPKDGWDKAQVVITAFTGIVALALTFINLSVTKNLSERANQAAEDFQKQQLAFQQNEDLRKRREETIQEITVLPSIMQLKNSPDAETRALVRDILERLKKDSIWKELPVAAIKSPSDSVATKTAIDSLGTAGRGRSFWVYIGQKENNAWQAKFFNVSGLPNLNTTIVSNANIYQRDTRPIKISKADDWKLGNPIGVLRQGTKVRVIDTLTLDGNNYWAKVETQ